MLDNPFIRDLSEQEYGLLARLFTPFDAPARTQIFKQGEAATFLYLLLEGNVYLRYKPYDGPKITLTHLHAGDIFGWSAVVGHAIYTSDAVSTTAIRTVRLQGHALRQVCAQDRVVGGRILEKLAKSVAPRWVDARQQIRVLLQESIQSV